MTQTIVFSNHKGGVGKTTSTVNIGAGLANYLNKKVIKYDDFLGFCEHHKAYRRFGVAPDGGE